jgi:hypothetical protein
MREQGVGDARALDGRTQLTPYEMSLIPDPKQRYREFYLNEIIRGRAYRMARQANPEADNSQLEREASKILKRLIKKIGKCESAKELHKRMEEVLDRKIIPPNLWLKNEKELYVGFIGYREVLEKYATTEMLLKEETSFCVLVPGH